MFFVITFSRSSRRFRVIRFRTPLVPLLAATGLIVVTAPGQSLASM